VLVNGRSPLLSERGKTKRKAFVANQSPLHRRGSGAWWADCLFDGRGESSATRR